MLGPDDQQRLLAIARRALAARVRREPAPPVAGGGALDAPRGAFVSIHRHGELRGCLGRLEPDTPVSRVVAHLAEAVADSDPRFDPVAPAELTAMQIEISVLTPEREVHGPEDIEVGRHGVIVEHGRQRGLLLPQVATEHGWDRHALLAQTCLKAGLPPDAWNTGARVFTFEAQVFAEPAKPSLL